MEEKTDEDDRGGTSMILLTRGSTLALTQARAAAAALSERGHDTEIRTISTHGDRDRKTHLAAFGGFGAFVKALEEEMLAGRGDAAVHSLKDVPSCLPSGLKMTAFLPRGPVHDVLVTREGLSLEELPEGATLGTSSLRRKAQVLRERPDLRIVPLRGNVETRLNRITEGAADATILAAAGMVRLGMSLAGTSVLPFVTAPCQGIIGIEARAGGKDEAALQSIDHFPTRMEALTERAFLARVGCGCHLPLAALARYEKGRVRIEAHVYADDGSQAESAVLESPVASDEEAASLGAALWRELADLPLARALVERARRDLGMKPATEGKEGNLT
jgi:hydroxymethylbilane synthase